MSDHILERYLLGELPEGRMAHIRAQVQADPALQARLDELEADNRRTLAAHPPQWAVPELERRLRVDRVARQVAAEQRRRERGWSFGPWAAVAAAAAAIALVIALGPLDSGTDPTPIPGTHDDGIRAKGLRPHLQLHRQIDGGAEALDLGAVAHGGDVLQVSYVAAERTHGVILSIDGAGAVTLHHPATTDGSTALKPGGTVALAHAYRLDDAPDFERFFFVTGARPLDVGRVVEAAERLAHDPDEALGGELPLGDDLEQSTFLLKKERP